MRVSRNSLVIFIIGILFCCCQSKKASTHEEINGFWKVKYSTKLNKLNYSFVQITDTSMFFWQPNIEYLPPYRYNISDDNSINIWLLEANTSEKRTLGLINKLEQESFQIENEERVSFFNKSSVEKFKSETGEAWVIK